MSEIAELVAESKRIDHRKNRWLGLAGGMVILGLVFQGALLARAADRQDKVLTLGEANHQLLAERNAQLQAQVDASRVILTQLYGALNASQRQVEALGGTPIHFEFEVPTTTTTVPGSPPTTTGSSSSQNASVAIEALIVSPVLVSLPLDVVVPPELTLPPVSIPPEVTVVTVPEITVPPVPDVTLPTLGDVVPAVPSP